jgi:hypothetical protein
VRADVLTEIGGFDEDLKRVEDWDLWLRLARTGRPAWAPRPLIAYRFHPGNAPVETASFIAERVLLAERRGLDLDIAVAHRRAAWVCLRGGRRIAALGHYAAAVRAGDLTSVARMAVGLLHPAAGSDRVFGLLRSRKSRDALHAWNEDAERWLEPLRAFTSTDSREPAG